MSTDGPSIYVTEPYYSCEHPAASLEDHNDTTLQRSIEGIELNSPIVVDIL
jgi:hypothetical protein